MQGLTAPAANVNAVRAWYVEGGAPWRRAPGRSLRGCALGCPAPPARPQYRPSVSKRGGSVREHAIDEPLARGPAGSSLPAWIRALEAQVGQVILGKDDAIRLVLIALLAGGHVLAEDVPGVGKTTLLKAVARSLSLDFSRLQCTPDLLPSDVTGVTFFDPAERTFRFRPGPVFSHILLADEINRATPRTQSALLEAMAEGQVTTDGETRPLPTPFWVVATQNPVESQGTYPLPEAQLDRFLMRIEVGYPDAASEVALLIGRTATDPVTGLQGVAQAADVIAARSAAQGVYLAAPVAEYIVDIVQATRTSEHILLGASPRAALDLSRAARARAYLAGRDHVLPDDVKALAVPVLAHRLIADASSRLTGRSATSLVTTLLETVPSPRETPFPDPGAR